MRPKRNHYWWVRARKEIAPYLLDPYADCEALGKRFDITQRTVHKWHKIVQEKGVEALIQIHDGRPEGGTFQAAAWTAAWAQLKRWRKMLQTRLPDWGALYAIGDPAQPVYRFRRAIEPTNLADLCAHGPKFGDLIED